MRIPTLLVSVPLCGLLACGGGEDEKGQSADAGLPDARVIAAPQLGDGEVTFTAIAGKADGLNDPRDLAFNPLRPDELWIVNYNDDSMVIVTNASTDARTIEKRIDGYAMHFMEQVTAIAFGADDTTFGLPGTFATCGESRNTYNGQAPGNDFTGPTLWSSDLTIFAKKNPNGLGSHLDMLHNTPLCMGIAHEAGNRYWVFNGLIGAIDRYDFVEDDGIGNDDHSDGRTWRYAPGTLSRVEGVPSHLALDNDSGILYIADTGNGRIARLDTKAGTEGKLSQGLETTIRAMDGVEIEDFVPASTGDFKQPSGIELAKDILLVSDSETGLISAVDLEGKVVKTLDTRLPAGALGGIALGPDGKLYLVNRAENQVLRVDPAQ